MRWSLLAAAVAFHTGKTIKILLKNGILDFPKSIVES